MDVSADNSTCASDSEWDELQEEIGVLDFNLWYLDTVSYQQQAWNTVYTQFDITFQIETSTEIYFQNTLVETQSVSRTYQ